MSFIEKISPCIGVCKLDTQGTCQGCLRTISEIGAWPQLSIAQRRQIMERIVHAREDQAARASRLGPAEDGRQSDASDC